MSNLIASFNFSTGSIIQMEDFSANGIVSESLTGITIGSGVVGNTGKFDGSTSTIKFGNIFDFGGGLANLSCLIQLKKSTSKDQILITQDQTFSVTLNLDDTITFSIFIADNKTLTSTGTIANGVTSTIQCIYDGVNMSIYIDGVFDSDKPQVGNITSSGSDFAIGHENTPSDSLFFDGEIEAIDIRSDALIIDIGLDIDEIEAWHDNPLGTEYEFEGNHNLELGDILGGGKVFALGLPEIIGTVSLFIDTSTIRIKPILRQFNFNEVPVRRGNIIDPDRQWLAEFNIAETNQPFIQIKDRIKTVVASQSSVEAFKGVKLTKDASIFKNALIPDFTIEPPSLPAGAINDFAPDDLEFANTLYISSDNNSSWNGLKAPVPLRPQLIFIINSGSKIINAKPEAPGSLPENRFKINGNVSFNPDDMGFALYDVTRLRWRLNKI